MYLESLHLSVIDLNGNDLMEIQQDSYSLGLY